MYIEKHFTDNTNTDQNITDVRELIHLGTPKFAQKFYQWLDNNKKLTTTDPWSRSIHYMYLDLMKQTSDVSKKLSWLFWTLHGESFTTIEEGVEIKARIHKQLASPENAKLRDAYKNFLETSNTKCGK